MNTHSHPQNQNWHRFGLPLMVLLLMVFIPRLIPAQGPSEPPESGKELVQAQTGSQGAQVRSFTDLPSAQNLARTRRVVLFFYASWCPTCRAAKQDIAARLDTLPGDLTLLYVDYDSSDALKQEYRVTYQHTFVQIDPQGKALAAWNGGGSDRILSQLR